MADDVERYRRDLKAALADVEILRRGELPAGTDPETLPVLESWGYSADGPVPLLVGVVSGHPKIPDGRTITTSPLFWIDERRRLARTRSRLYRLGPSLADLLNAAERHDA